MDSVVLQLLPGRADGLGAAPWRGALERSGARREGVAGVQALVGASPAALREPGLNAAASLATHFAAGLARAALTTTSGLAVGIDSANHEGALAARIVTQGALLSEFPPDTPLLARGCHALIRHGATLLESIDDILRELNLTDNIQALTSDSDCHRVGRGRDGTLDKASKILLDALGFEASSVDMLVARTGLPSRTVASKLLILELEGAVEPQAGGLYVRSSGHPIR